ncbi:hypothetical protein KDL44_11120 [bacterium]|nr:hypothetical protein [bacterium]
MHSIFRILALIVLAALCGCGSGSGFDRPQAFLGASPSNFGGTNGDDVASRAVATEILNGRSFDLSPNDWVLESGPVTSTSEGIVNDFGAGEGEQNVVSLTGSIDMRIISREAAITDVRLFGVYSLSDATVANATEGTSFPISWTVSWQDLDQAFQVTCSQELTGVLWQDSSLFFN